MFVRNVLSFLPIFGALVVPLSATPLHRRQALQPTGSSSTILSNGPVQTGTAPGPESTDQSRAGVLLSNQKDSPQTFYFVQNAENACNGPGSAGGGTPDAWITLKKEDGEVFVPRPSDYRGRIMRGPAPGSGPTPDLGLSRLATYAEINMDEFPCSAGADYMKVAGVTVSLNNGYDGPIYVHSTNSDSDWSANGDPLVAGFKEDLFASDPQPQGVSPTIRDGVKVGGYDQAQGANPASGPWTNFYRAHLTQDTQHLRHNYGPGTPMTSEVAYWGNAQDGATPVFSTNYVVKVAFY